MTELQLADKFRLPLRAVTETLAVLAKRGSGKTSTAVVLAEEMVGAGQQVLVIDPTGVWWGLRAGQDGGQAGGLPVVIIGGDHADLPLRETDGAALAALLVAERISAVLDLSQLSKSATRRVMTDFLETLYRVNRDPLHLIVDEADLLAPQRLPRDMTRLLGAMDDVVRRGRTHGLGVTLITQRPAVLNKDVLGQVEVLITLRMTNPRDVAAIDEWIRLHAEPDQATELRRSLPSLPVGTAWIWSPGWLGRLERVAIRRRSTFDSSATPEPGAVARRPRLAAIDVARLRQQLEPAPPQTGARGNQPAAELAAARRQIAALQRTIQALQDRPPAVEIREVPVLDPAIQDRMATLEEHLQTVTDMARELRDTMAAAIAVAGQPATPDSSASTTVPVPSALASRPPATAASTASVIVDVGGSVPLRAGARRMLAALASHHPAHITRTQLATLARMKPSSGTYSTYLSDLRRHHFIDETDGAVSITAAGRAAVNAGPPVVAMTAEQVREQWRTVLRAGARRMLDTLITAYPLTITRAELAAAADLAPTSGTFTTYLSDLRRNGLATDTAEGLVAADILFRDPGQAAG